MIYSKEINNTETQYFIIDLGAHDQRDLEYSYHTWNKYRYNLIKRNDLFIYRTPQKISPSRKFFFFGSGKFGKIFTAKKGYKQYFSEGDQYSFVEKAYHFNKLIFQDDLSPNDLIDRRKKKKNDWEHFFNQYGINKITKKEFLFLLNMGIGNNKFLVRDNKLMIETINQINKENYYVPDKKVSSKTRGIYQKIFSDRVKNNYHNQCAVTGIKTRELLVGSHIIPWGKNKKKRLDPKNGICFSSLIDKCFDKGFLTINNDYKVILSPKIKKDKKLYLELSKFEKKRIKLPDDKLNYPALENLKSHWKEFGFF